VPALAASDIERVFREEYGRAVAVLVRHFGDIDVAEEAVQDAFAGLVRGRRKFRGDAPVEAWAWRAVINAARKKRWSYAREARVRSAVASSNGSIPAAESDSGLALLVAALPERQRLALFLRYYADLDYRRIAAVLDVEVGTVSASLHAALKTLRRALEEAPA